MALLILLVLACVIGGGTVIYVTGQTLAVKRRLSRAEDLIDTLQNDAAEHIALGDNYAQIVADEIRQYRRTNRKELT